jgi:hypothetical protein
MKMKKMFLLGMVALLIPAAGCKNKTEKTSSELLDAMLKNDAAKLEKVLGGLNVPGLSEDIAKSLTSGKNASPAGDFAYDLNEAGDGIVITKYTGNGGVVVIPATIEGYPVVELKSYLFHQNDDITSVVVPPGVKEIPREAFVMCESLTTVILPDAVEKIGLQAFGGCTSLQTVNLPAGLKIIGYEAFVACGELYKLTIPDSLIAVSGQNGWGRDENRFEWAFKACGKLPLKTRQRLKDLGYTGDF